eukprot:1676625-Amphidinium_carterae.1
MECVAVYHWYLNGKICLRSVTRVSNVFLGIRRRSPRSDATFGNGQRSAVRRVFFVAMWASLGVLGHCTEVVILGVAGLKRVVSFCK